MSAFATAGATPPLVINLASVAVVSGLFMAGTYLLLQRALMRVLIGLVLLGHATNLLLLLVGGPSGRPAMAGAHGEVSDPLPQAMALTSIVITFALTTFLLALAYRSWTLLGDAEVRDDVEDHRLHVLEERLEAQAAHHRRAHHQRPHHQRPRHEQPRDQQPAAGPGARPPAGADSPPDGAAG